MAGERLTPAHVVSEDGEPAPGAWFVVSGEGWRRRRRLTPGSFAENVRELGPPPEPLTWGELYGTPAFDTGAGWRPVELYLQEELTHAQACAQLRRNAHEALGTHQGTGGEGIAAAAVELTCWPSILHESALATFRGWVEAERPALDLNDPDEWPLALQAAERVAYAAWACKSRAELREALAEARQALAGDSNDAEHDALYCLAEALAAYMGADHA